MVSISFSSPQHINYFPIFTKQPTNQMINFLRKTRNKMADDNRPLKYMRYAVGEIVLVVVGILIALSINNWNEERKKDISMKGHLISLVQAIQHDIREQSISMEFNEFRFHSWNYLLKISGVYMDSLEDIPRPSSYIVHTWDDPYPEKLNKRFINTSLDQLNSPFIDIYFNHSAINEINNLGVLSDLENDSLKKNINDYYYNLEWKFGPQSTNRRYELAKDLRVYLMENHEISCNYPPHPERIIQVIKEDPKVVIMLKDLIITSHRHYWVTKDLREFGSNLVDLINKVLD